MLSESMKQRLAEGMQAYKMWHRELIGEIIAITEVPAPTFYEANRAAYVAKRFAEIGYPGARVDQAGNVRVEIPGESRSSIMFAAHLDTVFPDAAITVVCDKDNNALRAPGVGDNSAHVAAMLYLARLIAHMGWKPRYSLTLVADVCEEGLGDLKGVKVATRDETARLNAVLALDGLVGHIVDTGVGSRRYQVNVTAQGGHSWHDFGATSAVELLGDLIGRIHEMKVPSEARTTFNIGKVEGGTSINTIPESASMLVDLRSLSPGCLDQIETQFLSIVNGAGQRSGYGVELEKVGDRPAGTLAANRRLVNIVHEALAGVGMEGHVTASSTDANFPISLGIPAISFGLFKAYDAHRPSEWLDLDSVSKGMELLLRTWLLLDEA